jgi:hypothetical protein
MTGKLDWKWIVRGVLIMVALNVGGAFIISLALGPQLTEGTLDTFNLTGGQILLALVINTLSFLIGGFIVGVKSTGRTILEPGISALIAVAIVLLLARQLTPVTLIAGGIVPFAAAILGGWLGERRQGT